jgi:hypothetical protein
MYDLNTRIVREGASFAEQYLLNRGLKIFGRKGRDASKKEMDQLHRRSCFTTPPISIAESNDSDRTKKGATSADVLRREAKRNYQRKNDLQWKANKRMAIWLSKEDSASPTAVLESIMITAVIDAQEERAVMTCDIPNAFIQALMPEVEDGDKRVMMKTTGALVDMLGKLNPELYGPYVVYEKNRKALYVQVMRAMDLRNVRGCPFMVQEVPRRAGTKMIQVQSL